MQRSATIATSKVITEISVHTLHKDGGYDLTVPGAVAVPRSSATTSFRRRRHAHSRSIAARASRRARLSPSRRESEIQDRETILRLKGG